MAFSEKHQSTLIEVLLEQIISLQSQVEGRDTEIKTLENVNAGLMNEVANSIKDFNNLNNDFRNLVAEKNNLQRIVRGQIN